MTARHLFAMLALTSGTAGCPAPPSTPGDTQEVAVDAVRDLGLVQNASLSQVLREGGAAGRVGGKVLWTFGDTFAPTADGRALVSSSGSYAEFTAPMVLSEPVDARGAPYQLLPFTAEEASYNAAGSLEQRYALQPAAVIPKGENAMILYARVKLRPGAVDPVSVGFAEVEPWKTVAVRKAEVFTASEPQFRDAAALDAGDLYLYACDATGMCKVARAAYERVTERAAYTFWTGSSWSASAADAAAVVPGSTSGFSVSYDTYLERFESIASVPGTGKIIMRVSSRPEGPWGEPIAVHDEGAPIHATVQHPELASDAGRTLYVSYASAQGALHLVEVKLR